MFPRFLTAVFFVLALGLLFYPPAAFAQKGVSEAGSSASLTPVSIIAQATPSASGGIEDKDKVIDLTNPLKTQIHELEAVLASQNPGPVLLNPLKYAIRNAVASSVPINTIVLLLLLPVVASIITAARHLVGLRSFGIFLPAALSITFVAIGPVLGIGLFLVIVAISTLARIIFRKLKLRLQYLPRMALILWLVSLGVLAVLFASPVFGSKGFGDVSIFPVLFLVLLSEDFTRVQIGKSIGVAVSLTSETLILALLSFAVLSTEAVQHFALLNPEILVVGAAVFNFFLGKYAGLRVLEVWRFRKLIAK